VTRARPLVLAALAAIGTVVAYVVLAAVLPKGAPLGIVAVGVVFGSLNALVAIGIVLIYRFNRVINFAQAEFGSVAAVLAIEFKLQLHWNYFLAIGAGLVAAVVLGGLIEVLIIRRFANAPRLILAVATIGLAQVLNGLAILIPLWWTGQSAERFDTPFRMSFTISPVVMNGNYVLAIVAVPVVVVALTVFLRSSAYGVAIRASADNSDRASLLGIPVRRLSTVVWAIAAVLSALAVILRVPILGFSSFTSVSGGGFSLLLRTLAAAAIGGMESLPVTAGAAVALGIVQELGAWTFGNSTYVDALLLVVILVALLVRRERFARARETGIGTWRAIHEVRPIPQELRNVAEVRYGLLGLRLALIAAAVLIPIGLAPARQQLLGLILIYAIIAVSLVVLTGWGGHISLGHFAFAGFGAATTGVLLANHGVDLFLAIPAGVLVAAAAAFLVGLPALRVPGPFLAVSTLAFAVTSSTFFLDHRYVPWFVPDLVPRPALWNRVPFDSDLAMYYVALFGLVLAMAVARSLRKSRTGRALVATRDNASAAKSVSIDTTRVKLTAFAVSGGIAGFAGALYVLHQTAFKTDAFGPEVSLRLFSMVVIGGLGSLPGAIIGAAYIRGAEFFLRGGWALVASGAGIVLLLLFQPGGLGALLYRARDGYLRWVARRHGLVVPSLVADQRIVDDSEAPAVLSSALEGLGEAEPAEASTKLELPEEAGV
jgi:branched-chain amino acid transport system permease protein